MASAYCLALCVAGGASQILLAGFDGYEKADPRQEDMIEVFEAYERCLDKVPIVAVTPTSYPILQQSIYAPTRPATPTAVKS
jgi:4-hydroxy 2-oxovalerate aldolase